MQKGFVLFVDNIWWKHGVQPRIPVDFLLEHITNILQDMNLILAWRRIGAGVSTGLQIQ